MAFKGAKIIDNYTILHLHSMDSNPYSGLEVDSITDFHEYINLAKENGMKAIAFTEHGCVLHNVAKKQACEKAGIKYIHAEEFYVTEKINVDEFNQDANVLTRDNYHCSLFARNYDGVRELNALSSNTAYLASLCSQIRAESNHVTRGAILEFHGLNSWNNHGINSAIVG